MLDEAGGITRWLSGICALALDRAAKQFFCSKFLSRQIMSNTQRAQKVTREELFRLV
jgi:hypothetical protein